MRVKIDSGQLKRAAKAVVSLNSFAKEKKSEATVDKDTFPCMLTARKGKLSVEGTIFGLYLRYDLDAEVKQEGRFGAVAAPLKNLPENETLELSRVSSTEGKGKEKVQTSKLRIKLRTSNYILSEHTQAEEIVSSGRLYDRKQIKKHQATLPFSVLKEAVSSVTFKPGLPTETLRLQIAIKKGIFEVSGTDTFGMARMQIQDKRIKVVRPISVMVKTGLLGLLAEELMTEEDEEATVGVLMDQDKQPVALFVGTSRMELWHPVLSGTTERNYEELIGAYYEQHKIRVKFKAQTKEIQSAVNTVTALWSGDSASSIELVANSGAVSLQAETQGQTSNAVMLTEGKIVAKGEQSVKLPLHYLKAFLGLAPALINLEVNVCGEEIIHLVAQVEPSKRAEFVLSQEVPAGVES
jgi:hypothetical protein